MSGEFNSQLQTQHSELLQLPFESIDKTVELALGAQPSELLRMIVGQAAKLAGAGAPMLDSQLYGVRPIDPMTFVMVPLVLLMTATLAAVVPARIAMRVDPVTALRIE